MSQSKIGLRRQAALKALQVRSQLPAGLGDAVSPYDVATKVAKVIVRFYELPLEGIFHATSPRIILSSLRPWVRQNFTCAHELGHFFLGHGFQVEELVELRDVASYDIPEELSADAFAAELLMPKTTINSGFNSRGFKIQNCNPWEFYIVSQWLGVGYETLLKHLRYFVKAINEDQFNGLKRNKRQNIRAEILGEPCKSELFIVDENWRGRSTDVAIGDFLLSDQSLAFSCDGFFDLCDKPRAAFRFCYKAVKRGKLAITSINGIPHQLSVRVSPQAYVGLENYRYFE